MLIRWLAAVTSREAMRTNLEHDHLRAALFFGMDEMRKVYSRGGPFLTVQERLTAEHFSKVYHAALNGAWPEIIVG